MRSVRRVESYKKMTTRMEHLEGTIEIDKIFGTFLGTLFIVRLFTVSS